MKNLFLIFLFIPLNLFAQGWIQVYNPVIGNQISISKSIIIFSNTGERIYFTTSGLTGAPYIGCNDTNIFNTFRFVNQNNIVYKPHNTFLKTYRCYDPINEYCNFNPVSDFEISKLDTNFILRYVIYGGDFCNSQIIKRIDISSNNGQTFVTSFTNVSQFGGFSISRQNDSIIFAVVNNILYKSTNRGNNWTNYNSYPSIISVKFNPYNDNYVYLIGSSGIFVSSNGGLNFSLQSLNVFKDIYFQNEQFIYGILSNNQQLFRSSNAGLNWNNIFTTNIFNFNILSFDIQNSNIIYAGSDRGVWRSIDNGSNFIKYNNTFPISNNILNLFKSSDSDTLTVVTNKGIFKTFSSFVDVERTENQLKNFELLDNYPNPFNSSTNIVYYLPQKSEVSFKIFDINGKEIETLQNKDETAGTHLLNWNVSNLPSGIYFLKMSVKNNQENIGYYNKIKKLILLK